MAAQAPPKPGTVSPEVETLANEIGATAGSTNPFDVRGPELGPDGEMHEPGDRIKLASGEWYTVQGRVLTADEQNDLRGSAREGETQPPGPALQWTPLRYANAATDEIARQTAVDQIASDEAARFAHQESNRRFQRQKANILAGLPPDYDEQVESAKTAPLAAVMVDLAACVPGWINDVDDNRWPARGRIAISGVGRVMVYPDETRSFIVADHLGRDAALAYMDAVAEHFNKKALTVTP